MKFINLPSLGLASCLLTLTVSCASEQKSESKQTVNIEQTKFRIVPGQGITVTASVDALVARLKKMSLDDPVVKIVEGTDDVVTFELPSTCDTDMMIRTIGAPGHTVIYRLLTAREAGVDNANPDAITLDTAYNADDKRNAMASINFDGRAKPVWSMQQKIRPAENPDSIVDGYILYSIQPDNAFDYAVKNATAKNVDGRMQVLVVYDSDGMRALPGYTERNVGHHIAVVVDDEVVSVPYLSEKISVGRLSVTGNYTPEQFHQISAWMTPVNARFSLVPVR